MGCAVFGIIFSFVAWELLGLSKDGVPRWRVNIDEAQASSTP